MEEAASADLVLHLVDLSHADYLEHLEVGKQVLLDLGIPRDRVFEVFNKIDRFAGPLSRDRDTIAVSAVTGENVDVMLDMIRRREISQGRTLHLRIPIEESRSIARVHELGQVHEQSQADGHYSFLVWLPEEAIYQFSSYLSPEDHDVVDP
jgi:GTP-binding protein HflX